MLQPGVTSNITIERDPAADTVFARLRPGQQWVWSNHQITHLVAKLPRRVTIKDVRLASYAVIVREQQMPLHPNLFVDGTYSVLNPIDDKLEGEYTTYYKQMPAVAVPQPWAWAIASGLCSLINRTDQPGSALRKRVWIYADDLDSHGWLEMKRQGIPGLPDEKAFTTGALIGSAVIGQAVTQIRSQWFRGPVAWVLAGVLPVPAPIPTKKHEGLWVPELYR